MNKQEVKTIKKIQTTQKEKILKENKNSQDNNKVINNTVKIKKNIIKNEEKKEAQKKETKKEDNNSKTIIVPLENNVKTNSCFMNVIVQTLYHSPLIKEEINKLIFEQEDNPLYQLKDLFLEYQKFQNEPKSEKFLNTKNLRISLSEMFPYIVDSTQTGDPIDVLNLFFNVFHLYEIKKDLKDNNSSSYNCGNKCLSHKFFPLRVKEKLTCLNCNKNQIINYDNNYFIYEIFAFEILEFCDKKETKDFRNNLFSFCKKINSRVENYMKVKECKCKTPKIEKSLILFENTNHNLIVNLTWETPFPLLSNICKIYTLIPQITSNLDLFELENKNLEKKYYLYGLIVWYNGHYENAIYIYNQNLWYLCDDSKIQNFESYKQLVIFLIKNHFHPIILFYSINSYNYEIDKDEVFHTKDYDKIYNSCFEIDKKGGNKPSMNYNLYDSTLTHSLCLNIKFNAIQNYQKNLKKNSKEIILDSIIVDNNLISTDIWICKNCKKKNNIKNNKCQICHQEFLIKENKDLNNIEIESPEFAETLYQKDFYNIRIKENKENKIKTKEEKNKEFLNGKFLNGISVKDIKSEKLKSENKKIDRVMGENYIGNSNTKK